VLQAVSVWLQICMPLPLLSMQHTDVQNADPCMQVYKEPFCRRHHASVLSFAVALRVVGYLGCIVLSYTLAYATGEMWMRRKVISTQPDVHFAYRALAFFSVRCNLLHLL
jgi:Transmembrane protein 231